MARPGREDILVEGIVSLVSAGTEMSVYRGESASPDEFKLPTVAGEWPFPVKFGYQIVGRVLEAGSQSGFKSGDVVFAYHPHQELFRVATNGAGSDDLVKGAPLVFPVPEGLTAERAAFANLFSVAYNAVLDVPIRVGDVVAVSGLGVIGSFAAHLARLTAGRLVLVDPAAARRDRAGWIGADAAVHPDDAVTAVMELSDGRGADVYIEASGATPALQTAVDAVGQEGTVTVISYYGNRPATLRLSPEFHLRRERIVSSQVGTIGSGLEPRWDARRRMGVAMERLMGIEVDRVLVTHRFPFDRAVEAYTLIDTSPQESVGVLLEYGAS